MKYRIKGDTHNRYTYQYRDSLWLYWKNSHHRFSTKEQTIEAILQLEREHIHNSTVYAELEIIYNPAPC